MPCDCELLTQARLLAEISKLPVDQVVCPPEMLAVCKGTRCLLADAQGKPFDETGFLDAPKFPRSPEVENFMIRAQISRAMRGQV